MLSTRISKLWTFPAFWQQDFYNVVEQIQFYVPGEPFAIPEFWLFAWNNHALDDKRHTIPPTRQFDQGGKWLASDQYGKHEFP